MPFCDDCEKYWAPSAMTPEGECPTCGAAPNEWCTRADGHTRRTPCIKRIRPSVGVAEFGDHVSPLYVAKKSQEGNSP